MGIAFDSDIITITDGTYSFNDIFEACSDGSITKSSNMYNISKSIFVGNKNMSNPAQLIDSKVCVTIARQ